jgi:hypothetical protein
MKKWDEERGAIAGMTGLIVLFVVLLVALP